MVCDRVAEVLRGAGHEVELLMAKMSGPEDLEGADLLVFASPTHGHGILEKYFEKFLGGLEGVDLKGRNCAIIGLGEVKYDPDYHLESIRIIMMFLRRKEANIVGMPLRVAQNPLKMMDNYILPWAEKLGEMV